MGIKRANEETNDVSEKKSKVETQFSMDLFLRNFQDPESRFLALSEFNEHVRHLTSEESIDPLMNQFLQSISTDFDEVLTLITEEKRKASENITLYRFLTTLMEYFARKNLFNRSEIIIKKILSTGTSIHTIYFMLSSHSTASHLKTTLRFLLSLVQQNEFSARLIFSAIDFKRPCWKPLLKRRDIRDVEDVRFWLIKFFLSPLAYRNIDLVKNLIKEHDIFHEIFNGLMNDSRTTVQFILDEIRTNIVMLPGITKTDKLHLFDDRNLKSLLRLYNWSGQQRQKDVNNKKKKNIDFEEVMEIEENGDRDEIRKIVHTFLMIILNSKNYGIHFFDSHFGTSNKNSNPVIFKVITNLSKQFLTDEYASNLIVTCLTTCPDLLQSFFKLITQEYISSRSKNLSNIIDFLCEIFEQQKPLTTYLNIFQTTTDSLKLTDIFINLTLPIEIMTKFDQTILKNSDATIQLSAMKFLTVILQRVKDALNLINDISFACDKNNTLESYQQAILRYIPKPDHFCESFKSNDSEQFLDPYINLLKLYSSSCFMSMSAMNINLDILLSNSLLHLLVFFKELLKKNEVKENSIENYFQCVKNLLDYRESIDDVTWARQNKELESTPIRMLFQLARQLSKIESSADYLSAIIVKFSSMITQQYQEELNIWFYTWLKLENEMKIEQFLANIIEKIILNPYPLLEKSIKDSGYSLMLFSALDVIEHAKTDIPREIDEYLCSVTFQIYLNQISRSSNEIHQHIRTIFLKEKKSLKIFQLLSNMSSPDRLHIELLERSILSNIDLSIGPDRIQIYLAMQLNLFKLFILNSSEDHSRLINEMIQCLNIVLLLHDPHRSFEILFERTIEYIQSYSSTQMINLICQLIHGLDRTHQRVHPLKHSNIFLQCLQAQPNNSQLIYFISHYLENEYRREFLDLICQTVTDDVDIFKILIREIRLNKTIHDERFLDAIIDGFKYFHDELDQGLECALELIERMKNHSHKNWKNVLRLKQKPLFKLTKKDYPQSHTRILIAKLIVQTIMALRSADRSEMINRLVHKSSHSLLLHAYIFYDLLNLQQSIDSEEFLVYLQQLLQEYSSEGIVCDLLRVYNQPEKIFPLLQNQSEENDLPIQQTNRLLLILKLFPENISTAEQIYQSLINKSREFSSANLDAWLIAFEQCTTRLLNQTQTPIDLYELINRLLKFFSILSVHVLNLLKALIEFFVTQQSIDQKHLSKLFAHLLKHPNFLEQLSSDHRSILMDILSLFVSHYQPTESSITIECSKHFPMLLSIYHPTLSNNDQHTLACMYAYEKQGFSMKSAFVWGEAALELYGKSMETKSVLFQASKLEQVMRLLDERKMSKSIAFYPVTRRLRTIEPKVYDEGDDIYDPAYLIPVFYHSLGSECVVKCQEFIEKHCLAYCLMALSSRCGLLRAVVYNCLFRFEQHLLSQRFYCKEQILTMFTLLKQSMKKSNLKLAPIVALFLSKLVDLFTHPESKIYRTITRFLLKQPYIDLVHIPLFGELFHSSSIEYKYERGWILNLLKHGIKDSIDYTLCTKAYVFKTLMTFYQCSLCDESTKMEILHVFHSTSKLQEVLMSLLFDYGFLLWLQMVIKHCSSDKLTILSSIIQNIAHRLTSNDNQVQLYEFECLLIVFIRRLKTESTISSTIADMIMSTLLKQPSRLQILKNSIDIQPIVDRSTIVNNRSLLSCFC